MLSYQEARELADANIRQIGTSEGPFVIVDQETIEKPFGWVFFFNSEAFIETGDFEHALAGNGPIVVNKYDHTVEFFGPVNWRGSVDEYEKNWSTTHRASKP